VSLRNLGLWELPRLPKNPNWNTSIQRSAVSNQSRQKGGKSTKNAGDIAVRRLDAKAD
jgi:hypothetical protein